MWARVSEHPPSGDLEQQFGFWTLGLRTYTAIKLVERMAEKKKKREQHNCQSEFRKLPSYSNSQNHTNGDQLGSALRGFGSWPTVDQKLALAPNAGSLIIRIGPFYYNCNKEPPK